VFQIAPSHYYWPRWSYGPHVCPNCGHCPTCGRVPAVPIVPVVPVPVTPHPIWGRAAHTITVLSG